MLVLIVGCVYMITYPLIKYYYIIKRVYFIYKFFLLFISTFSFLLFFIQHHRSIRHITSIPICTYRFILSSILLTPMKLNIRQLYTIFVLTIQKRSRFKLGPPSPLFVATPLYIEKRKLVPFLKELILKYIILNYYFQIQECCMFPLMFKF